MDFLQAAAAKYDPKDFQVEVTAFETGDKLVLDVSKIKNFRQVDEGHTVVHYNNDFLNIKQKAQNLADVINGEPAQAWIDATRKRLIEENNSSCLTAQDEQRLRDAVITSRYANAHPDHYLFVPDENGVYQNVAGQGYDLVTLRSAAEAAQDLGLSKMKLS